MRPSILPLAVVVLNVYCVTAFAERNVIYEKDSRYSTIVVTEDEQGVRTLYFDENGARQSVVKPGDPDHIELPYARAMFVGLAIAEKPRRVLVVGLGGGTIPSFLHKHYPRMTIDVVDIDPDVVDVAKRFFGFREDATLRAYVDDGRRFIESRENVYDMIFLDAFSADSIPYHLATREFLEAVRQALTPRGIAISNIWSRTSNPLYDSMIRTYQDTFEQLYILDVSGASNKVFIALPRQRQFDRNALAQRAAAISREQQFRFDMGSAVTYGFREVTEKNTRGSILRDKRPAKKAG